ncbi:MAG: GNAT family N-acetyltransferase [Candidatus Limnocylindria bacterium]
MTAPALDMAPACPGAVEAPRPTPTDAADAHERGRLRAERRPFDSIPRDTWDALAARTRWSTPFSAWAFHRAWWDAYSANAHEETVVLLAADGGDDAPIVAIVPLMHRHEVEPTDALTHTGLRSGPSEDATPVPPTAKAIFFGASYHADYATILADPADLGDVAAAMAAYLAGPEAGPWDAVDLRRIRCGDPTAEALGAAIGAREIECGWTLNVEREDVCPVATLPLGGSVDDYLAGLGKKERHEIRRKVRRAESVGEVVLEDAADPLAELESFIDLHQRRWGDAGLFPPTLGGDQSRVLMRRAFELFGPDGSLRLTFLSVGGRRIAAGVHFQTPDAILYYNAGVDPDARELSPGVLMVYAYVRRALAAGIARMDFLRGNESYKYEWGAVDEPIQRLLVRRRVG